MIFFGQLCKDTSVWFLAVQGPYILNFYEHLAKDIAMNLQYKGLVPTEFANDSRVWIYQSNRSFNMNEVVLVEDLLNRFVGSWHSHGIPVKGFATIFFGHFIILMADETASGVSGCSTDSSVRLIKEIEKQFSVDLFNRQLLAFIIDDKIELLAISKLANAAENNLLNQDSLYFDNTVSNKVELENNWITTIEKSWIGRRIPFKKALSS
jgi:hypothetical protein